MFFKSNAPTSRPPRAALPCIAWGCLFLFAWLGFVQQASAAFFTFSTTPPDPNAPLPNGATVTLSQDSYTTAGDNLDANAPDGTDIVYGRISLTGLVQGSAAQAISIPYSFHVFLTDYSTGTTAAPNGVPVEFVISGLLSGTVGPNKKVNITNTFTLPSISLPVGGDNYLMDLFSYVPPGVLNDGAFGGHLVVPAPEPSTIALLSFGALALATPAYRRWRRKTPRSSG